MQSNPSSVAPSQSSSVPLHVSGGGGQSVGGTQSGVQMARPVLPHVVVQSVASPGTHSMQAPQVQAGPHGWTLGVPQDVVQGCVCVVAPSRCTQGWTLECVRLADAIGCTDC